jgi:hypothetical protein
MTLLRRTDNWRRCMGLCVICGQPMAAPQFRLADGRVSTGAFWDDGNNNNNNNNNNGDGDDDVDSDATFFTAIDSDGRLLTNECPARLALMRFNALGELQAAHLVDDYTLLEAGRNKTSFRKQFAKYEPLALAAHPAALGLFKTQVMDDPTERIYAAATAMGRRVVADLTICGCRRCNKAMDRVPAHVNAVYRCFAVTRHSDVPALESNEKKATAVKKVLQQVALFFEPLFDSGGVVVGWRAKSEDKLLRDAAAWRCIAHLSNWGLSPMGGGVRFRMVAVFHAAHHIYLASSLRGLMDFQTWHLHLFRPYYTRHHEANTFLGMRQTEVARLFDLSRKDGRRWEEVLHGRMRAVGDALEGVYPDQPVAAITRFEETLAGAGVVDELSLLRFLSQRERAAKPAMAKLLSFFRYNLSGGSGARFMLSQCAALEQALCMAAKL